MKILKWIGIGLGSLVGLIALIVVILFFIGRSNLAVAPEIESSTLIVSNDAESLEHGRYLTMISHCSGCHGASHEGTAFLDEAPIGYVPAPNLTSGEGGIANDYTDADWERAIRHGVAADGRTMVIMPSEHYARYSDEDLADLIAYLKQIPAKNNDLGPREFLFPGNIIFGVLAFSSWPVNVIDHAEIGRDSPVVAPSAEYGEYLVNITSCNSCHTENLAGNYGQLDTPLGLNLTGLQDQWTLEEFSTALRSGLTPDGRQLNSEMPWATYSIMTENDVNALWSYLNSIEPLPNNQ
jgi:mono/diheme cytochrome c family protein